MTGGARELLFSVLSLHKPLRVAALLLWQSNFSVDYVGKTSRLLSTQVFSSLLLPSIFKTIFASLNHAGNSITNNARF